MKAKQINTLLCAGFHVPPSQLPSSPSNIGWLNGWFGMFVDQINQIEVHFTQSPHDACSSTRHHSLIHQCFSGNGPAALSLSAFLSGWTPFYSPNGKMHQNIAVHEKLVEHINESLLDQDFSWLENDVYMPSGGARPISLLFDSLMRPNADSGDIEKPLLRWEFDPSRAISHLVVGETPIGGSWTEHDEQMVSISSGNLLDLPAFTTSDWLGGDQLCKRFPVPMYRKYLNSYASAVCIRENILCGVKITQIRKRVNICNQRFWELRGLINGEPMLLRCKKVVLATGKNRERLLNVSGELASGDIVYNLRSLKHNLLSKFPILPQEKVVIVGDGVSAADALIYCLNNDIPVLQVIRRTQQQLRYLQLGRLSPVLYPEYARIYNLMIDRGSDPNYSKLTGASVLAFDGNVIVLKTQANQHVQKFRAACICIGKCSDMGMISDKYTFEDYMCTNDDSLYQIGSLAGDHFVRFLVGGSLEVARSLMSSSSEL